MNRYLGQYFNRGGWITFTIEAATMEEALIWTRMNIQKRGIAVSQIIPTELLQEEAWRRQGGHHSECNKTYKDAVAFKG